MQVRVVNHLFERAGECVEIGLPDTESDCVTEVRPVPGGRA